MDSRPQFSLRMLLLVTTVVALAAATVTDVPEERPMARNSQAALSIALCVLGAAALLGGAMAARGYSRTLFIGALFPALAPVVMFWVILWHVEARHPGTFAQGVTPTMDLLRRMGPLRRLFALSWAMIPVSALACWLWHDLLSRGARRYLAAGLRARWAFGLALALVWALTAWSLKALLRYLPENGTLAYAKGLLQFALAVVDPALWTVTAIRGRGLFRTFCLGGLFSALVGITSYAWGLGINVGGIYPDWPGVLVSVEFPSATMWVFSPLFGLTCAVFHWLFRRRL